MQFRNLFRKAPKEDIPPHIHGAPPQGSSRSPKPELPQATGPYAQAVGEVLSRAHLSKSGGASPG